MFYKYIRPCTCRCTHKWPYITYMRICVRLRVYADARCVFACVCVYTQTHAHKHKKKKSRTYAYAYPCQFSLSIKTFTPAFMPTSYKSRQAKTWPQVHANSKGSYQSAHPRSPMRVLAIRTEYASVLRNQQTDN